MTMDVEHVAADEVATMFVVVTVYHRHVRWVFDVVCRRRAQEEVLAMLPHGDVDGGSAMAAVQRLVIWATRHNAPDPRPCL